MRPTAVIQPTHRRHQLYRRLSTLTREALIYSNNDPRLGDQRPPKTPPSVARETASNDANIRPNHDTERIPRANRMHCVASPTITAGLAVSIPCVMCARGARHPAMNPPRIKPIDNAPVRTREFSLSSSTKLPMINPRITTTESEKKAPASHELRSIRCPKSKKSRRKAHFLLFDERTLN